MELALENPSSGYIVGQAVYALAKFGYHTDVWTVVEACQAEEWWCTALRGYALYARGRLGEAEAQFRSIMSWDAPLALCRLSDPFWLLGEWNQNTHAVDESEVPPPPESRVATREIPCMERIPASDTLFWYGDPLLSDAVNDRWTVHVGRSMQAWFFEEIQEARWGDAIPERFREYDWATRVRRGPWDSYYLPVGHFTSTDSAAYRFIPIVEPDNLSHPVWKLEATLYTEGFTPEYGPFLPLPVQLARFRTGDTLRLAAAGSIADTPLRRVTEAEVHLVLSDGPRSFPLKAQQEVGRRETPRFLEEAPALEYMVGVEALTENGIGWHRSFLSPLEGGGAELSDLLLYDPSLATEPRDLPEAADAMLGSTTVEEGGAVGVFWEVYGTPAQGELEFELTLEREAGGLVERLVGILPGGSQEGRGRVTWREPAVPELHPRGITLQLSTLSPGRYTLHLSVRWDGQEVLERRRALTVR
jgi:hypothetical protein